VSVRAFANGAKHVCGGSVLRPNVVLTAAHCVSPTLDKPNEPIGNGSPSVSINNYLLPGVLAAADVPDWDAPGGNPDAVPASGLVMSKAVVTTAGWNVSNNAWGGFDLALLLLEEDLVGVEPVKLPAPGTTYVAGDPFTIAGWGNIDPSGEFFIVPPTLMEAQVEYIPTQACVDMYEAVFTELGAVWEDELAAEGMWICAQGALENGAYTDICQGDSGGPLSIIDGNGDATVAGIVSFVGAPCGTVAGRAPGVYTNVAKFSSLIEGWIDVWERKHG